MKFNNTGTGYNDNTSLKSWVYSTLLKVPNYLNNMKGAPIKSIIGLRFNKLTIIARCEDNNKCTVQCDCGNVKNIKMSHVKDGRTKSCGCLGRGRSSKYTIKQNKKDAPYIRKPIHPLYSIWQGMKNRCRNKNQKFYPDYGGRGITVCEEWINDFMSFYDWALSNGYEKNLEIDRKNNDGNYEPSNCRFVSRKENCRNRRDNKFLTFKDETKTIAEWAEIMKIDYGALHSRIKRGWSVEDSLTKSTKVTIAVNQYDINGNFIKQWESFRELTLAGFNGSKICQCCKGRKNTSDGFKWKYA